MSVTFDYLVERLEEKLIPLDPADRAAMAVELAERERIPVRAARRRLDRAAHRREKRSR